MTHPQRGEDPIHEDILSLRTIARFIEMGTLSGDDASKLRAVADRFRDEIDRLEASRTAGELALANEKLAAEELG